MADKFGIGRVFVAGGETTIYSFLALADICIYCADAAQYVDQTVFTGFA